MFFQFDTPSEIAGWTLVGAAAIRPDDPPVSLPNALYLFASHSIFGNTDSGAFYTMTGLGVGKVLPIMLWTNGDTYGGQQLDLIVSDATQSVTFSLTDPLGSGWQLWEPGEFVPGDSTVMVELSTTHRGGATNSGNWLVDDFEIGEIEVGIGKWDAINNCLTGLRAINGTSGGWWHSFESRVYTKLVTPADFPGGAKFPYACLPLNQEAEAISYEDRAATSRWSMTLYGFFDEKHYNDVQNTDSVEMVSKLRDDLIRLVMGDQKLSGQTTNLEVVSVNSIAGITDDYAEVQAVIQFEQIFGRQNLGPAGV